MPITKTKTKRYIAICPICNKPVTPALQFRTQANERLRYHLGREHCLTITDIQERNIK